MMLRTRVLPPVLFLKIFFKYYSVGFWRNFISLKTIISYSEHIQPELCNRKTIAQLGSKPVFFTELQKFFTLYSLFNILMNYPG
jgi:hypothetical protein